MGVYTKEEKEYIQALETPIINSRKRQKLEEMNVGQLRVFLSQPNVDSTIDDLEKASHQRLVDELMVQTEAEIDEYLMLNQPGPSE